MGRAGWEVEAKEALERARSELLRDEQHPARRIGRYMKPYVANLAASSVAFNLGLFSSQCTGYALGICCTTPVMGPALGFLSVGAASVAAGQAGLRVERLLAGDRKPPQLRWEHVAIDAAVGIVFYKALGGRFRNVFPSHLAFPGAFASQSILAPGAQYASPAQKAELRRVFYRDGCHSCGVRSRSMRVIGDHQPPNKVVYGSQQAAKASLLPSSAAPDVLSKATRKAGLALASGKGTSESVQPLVDAFGWLFKTIPKEIKEVRACTQRFYPQCHDCSKKQAAVLRVGDRAASRQFLVLHPPWRLRVWSLSGVFPGLQHHTAGELPPVGRGRFRGGFTPDGETDRSSASSATTRRTAP